MHSCERIGFVGLGNIGGLMCERLLKAGLQVCVYDLRPEAVQRFIAKGATAATLAQIVREAATVLLSLPSDTEVDQVIFGPRGLLDGEAPRSCAVVVDLSSCRPSRTRERAERLLRHEIHLLDAPVSGGLARAQDGTLTIMVGGRVEAFERVRPILERLGTNIFYLGPSGNGHTAKAINNLLAATTLLATAEGIAVGIRAGLDPEALLRVVNTSSGRSHSSEFKLPKILKGDKEVGFTIGLMNKDIAIALDTAAEMGLPMVLGSLVRQLWTAVNRDHSERDHTEAVHIMEQLTGVRLTS